MKLLFLVPAVCLATTGCTQHKAENTPQPVYKNVGGPCEGCEAIHESSVPFAQLISVDTLPDFSEPGPKLLISGTVYKGDGKTPAPDVILYVYHTNQQGIYPKQGGETGWATRHGYLRGWVKTARNGQYRFYTLKPAPYPNSNIPAHIHITIKEPDKNEYYIDEFLFDDDPFLTAAERSRQEGRGGSGILHLQSANGMLTATRNIVLGKNIPDYPTAFSEAGLDSDALSVMR